MSYTCTAVGMNRDRLMDMKQGGASCGSFLREVEQLAPGAQQNLDDHFSCLTLGDANSTQMCIKLFQIASRQKGGHTPQQEKTQVKQNMCRTFYSHESPFDVPKRVSVFVDLLLGVLLAAVKQVERRIHSLVHKLTQH